MRLNLRCLATALLCCASTSAYACSGYDVVVVGGQSNAVGRGVYGTWAYPYPQTASRIFQVVRTYAAGEPDVHDYITAAQFTLSQAVEPLYNDTDILDVENPTRIGFAYAFAQILAAKETDQTRCVVLVPAAHSGSSVLAWNLITRQYAGDLSFFYLDMINRTKLALAKLPNSRVAAFLWEQGETDAETIASINTPTPLRLASLMPDVPTFQSTLTGVMAQLRTDLGCGFPLLMGQFAPSFISDFSTTPSIETNAKTIKAAVITAIQSVAANEPCADATMVGSGGLLTNSQEPDAPADATNLDFTHYSAASQIKFATRFYAAWKASPAH